MKYVIALIFVLMGLGAWLAYSSINELKGGGSTVTQMRDQIKKLERSLQDEQEKNRNNSTAYVKSDEVNALKAKIAELEAKASQTQGTGLDEIKKQVTDIDERLKKKEELTSCDQCAIENCILSQKKKLEKKTVVKRVVTKQPYKKPECPNKEKVIACVTEKITEWKANCKITTTPDKVKSSFISSEKQVTKNLHKEKETLIVSLEPGKTQVPDLSICLESKESLTKTCEQKYCAGY